MGWHNSLFFWLYTTKCWKQRRQITTDLLMYNNYLMPLDLDVSFYCCFYCKSMGGWGQAGECQLVWQVFCQAQLLKHMNLQRAASHFQKRNIAFRVHLNVNMRTKQLDQSDIMGKAFWQLRRCQQDGPGLAVSSLQLSSNSIFHIHVKPGLTVCCGYIDLKISQVFSLHLFSHNSVYRCLGSICREVEEYALKTFRI